MRKMWKLPFYYNMGKDMIYTKDQDKIAFLYYDSKNTKSFTFGEIHKISSRLSGFIKEKTQRGDRVAIISRVIPEILFIHISIYLQGRIAMPIAPVLGSSAIKLRIEKAYPKIIFSDNQNYERVVEIAKDYNIEIINIERELEEIYLKSREVEPEETYFDDPAILIFTSGSEGEQKGVLHAHKILIGRTEIFKFMCWRIDEKELIWNIADWGWMAGMFYGPFPALKLKIPFLMFRPQRFDPELFIKTIENFKITGVFATPTALRMVKNSGVKLKKKLEIKRILTAGEQAGEDLHNWTHQFFNLQLTEFYSQTEAGPLITNSPNLFKVKPGSVGKVPPGLQITLLDDQMNETEDEGELAVRAGAPIIMLGYWNEGFGSKLWNGWFRTGDILRKDQDGYFYFIGRKDNIIKTSGYRISAEEIEKVIIGCDFVDMCAVIPQKDDIRGYVIKALVKLKVGIHEKDAEKLKSEIRERVEKTLGPHVKPKEIEFVDSIPLTPTGKIKRK